MEIQSTFESRSRQPYGIAEGVRISAFDTSLGHSAVLVTKGKKNYQIEGFTSEVLSCLQEMSLSPNQLEQKLKQTNGESLLEGRVPQVLARLEQLGLIQCGNPEKDESRPKASHVPGRSSSYFVVQIPILPQRVLLPITRKITGLFSPLMWRVVPVLLVIQVVFLWHSGFSIWHAHLWPRGATLAAFLAANYLGLFAHELGHAAACVRFGVRHGPIGFAIYLIFPALYTDVTQSWKLDRKQRMIVDAGGIYMSLLLASGALLLFLSTKAVVFAQLACLYDVTVLWNLNPFIRMDGYWLLSDALGVPQLMSANREMTRWLFQWLAGTPQNQPRILSLPDRLRRAYIIYFLLFLVFVLYAGFRFYVYFAPYWVHSSPLLLHQIIQNCRINGLSWSVARDIFRLLALTLPLLGLGGYTIRYLLRIVAHLGAWLKGSLEDSMPNLNQMNRKL